MTAEDTALVCPACRPQGVDVTLRPGAALDGSSCGRCGGVFLPTTGSERLLHDELALDRAALLELSESFGGRRFPCPSCRARMRSLLLRGVDVDVCFHCGALWLEHGELRRLSGGRYVEPPPPPRHAATKTATLARPEATVRLDARHPLKKTGGSLLRTVGLAGVVVHALTHGSPVTLAGAIALVIAGTWLRRRWILDVFPRARRMLRSRRLLPTDARDENAERLDDGALIVVRPLGPFLAHSAFVDACGRELCPLDHGGRERVARKAHALARRLGVRVVIDSRLQGSAEPSSPRPFARPVRTLRFGLLNGPSAFLRFVAHDDVGRVPVVTLVNAVPARGNEDAEERLALCFYLEDENGRRLRLHDDGKRNTVIVDEGGDPVATIRRRNAVALEALTIALAGSAARLHLLLPLFGITAPLIDDAGVRWGSAVLLRNGFRLDFAPSAGERERLCGLLLAAQATLDATEFLRG